MAKKGRSKVPYARVQKVSEQFKSMGSAKHLCRIRSYLMTAKKTGNSPYDKLNNLFYTEN